MLSGHMKGIDRVRKKRARDISAYWTIRVRTVAFVTLAVFIYLVSSLIRRRLGSDHVQRFDSNLFVHHARLLADDHHDDHVDDHALDDHAVDDHAVDDHAADDHGTDDSHAFSLFGAISGLPIYPGTVGVIIIVGAVQMVHHAFHGLHTFTHDTPFHQMVQSIEKELMGVGFTAFAFKIMVDTTSFLSLEWFHALEYADILVPLFSFAYCGLGIMLILNSVQISTLWSQAYHLTLTQMLDNYYNLPGFVGYLPYGLLLAPFTPTIARMEFRIFQSIFCETYKIQKAAFAFNEYVEKVFEKYIMTIIEIRLVDWAALVAFVLLNWVRNWLRLDFEHCGHHDLNCEEHNNRVMFAIAGGVLLLLTVLMALESRRLEVSIMRQKGIRSIHTYPSYLKYMEESPEAKALDAERLNKDELKASAEGVKYSAIQEEIEAMGGDSSIIPGGAAGRADRGVHAASPAGHGGGGGNAANNANKFSASVKQAWKTKKNVIKRRKSVNTLGDNRATIRRASLMGGMGFNFAHLAALRAASANKAVAAGAIAEDDESDSDGSGPSSSSASSDPSESSNSGSDSGSEVFDVNAKRKHTSKPKPQAEASEGSGAEVENKPAGAQATSESAAASSTIGFSTGANSGVVAPFTVSPTGTTTAAAAADMTTSSAAAISLGAMQVQPGGSSSAVTLQPKRLPPIGVQRWKAAPLPKRSGFAHVFSRLQRRIDAFSATATSAADSSSARFGGEGHSEGAFDKEDSKLSWEEGAALKRKQQLPPIRTPAGASARAVLPAFGSPSAPADKPTAPPSIFTGLSPPGSNSQFFAEPAKNSPSPDTAPNSTVTPTLSAKKPGGGGSPSAEALLRANASPPRSSTRKLPGVEALATLPGVNASNSEDSAEDKGPTAEAGEGSASAPSAPAATPPARYVPRGAKIQLNPTKMAVEVTSEDAGAVGERGKSIRFTDLAAEDEKGGAGEGGEVGEGGGRHKQSLIPPPIGSLRYVPSSSATAVNSNNSGAQGEGAQGLATAGLPAGHASMMKRGSVGSIYSVTGGEEEAEEVPIAAVFFFHWPELYLEGVQSLIMLLALYWSLFFTNFVSAAGTSEWKVITFLPALICAVLLVYIVKCAVMLGAIHAVDCDAILEVLDQTEGARMLSALIKEKVLSILKEMGPDPQAELVNLFRQIDSDGSGNISRDEFAEYMNSIEIHFDRRRWMQVFRGIDTTFDNKITFEEFYVFMFPDHSLGKAMQERREAALQKDLKEKTEVRLQQLQKFASRGNTRMTFVPAKRQTQAQSQPAPQHNT